MDLYLKENGIGKNSRTYLTDIEVGKADRKEREPCPAHVMLVQLSDEFPKFEPAFRAFVRAEAIQSAPRQVPVCVASEGVAGKQKTIDEHNQSDKIEVE